MEGSVYQYYANVRTEPVEWLWYPYIPLGKLTVLQGDPGEGKSTFALNVVARITTGQPMPDGVPVKGKRVAIYQCAEDGIADTIKPRLQQAGADCERVAYIIDNDIAFDTGGRSNRNSDQGHTRQCIYYRPHSGIYPA